MSDVVQLNILEDAGVIRVANPPVNAISHPVRAGLVEAVTRAGEHARLAFLLLVCDGRTFMAGADIREFGRPWEPPGLPEVVDALEASRLPIVAVIHGTALGGGLEVALGCHYRLAFASARLGLPEVKLGLIPGAQGTQRLPRLTGVETALDMIVGGAPMSAERALDAGLVDGLLTSDVEDAGARAAAALVPARALVTERPPTPPLRERPIPGGDGAAALDACRQRLAPLPGGRFAPERAVQAVEAAVAHAGEAGGFEAGVAVERALFQECLDSAESAALRHVFFGEREVGKVPGLARDTPVREISRVGVIGGGTMGRGITIALLDAGLTVTLVERDRDALVAVSDALEAHYARAVAKGRIDEDTASARVGRFTGEHALDAVATCDLVIEAVYEDPDLKHEVFTSLDAVCRAGAILATNTSTLDVDAIATATARPQDVLGLHFFSPANIMRLLEIVRGARTADDVLATALAFARRIGKIGVVAGVCDGFIGNRMFDRYLCEMDALLLEGATITQVDEALERFGFRLGPCKVSDLAGIDVGYRIHQARAARRGASAAGPAGPGHVLERTLYEAGRLGQKAGAGFYRYQGGSYTAIPDPAALTLVREAAAVHGITARDVGDDEIVERCVLALVREGEQILEEGIALRPVDIDIVYVHGYGFPAWRGGPMFYADAHDLRSRD